MWLVRNALCEGMTDHITSHDLPHALGPKSNSLGYTCSVSHTPTTIMLVPFTLQADIHSFCHAFMVHF